MLGGAQGEVEEEEGGGRQAIFARSSLESHLQVHLENKGGRGAVDGMRLKPSLKLFCFCFFLFFFVIFFCYLFFVIVYLFCSFYKA